MKTIGRRTDHDGTLNPEIIQDGFKSGDEDAISEAKGSKTNGQAG